MSRGARVAPMLWLALLGAGGAAPAHAAREGTITVFAAASLADAFRELGARFERSHPGTRVVFNFAGSQQLVAQLEQGAGADVLATADERWMARAVERGLVQGDARRFARNRLVLIVPRSNPAPIDRLFDLARRGVKLVIGAESVPVGRYARQSIARIGGSPGAPADFARRVIRNVVSEEENVKSVVGKVQLGEADAGIVYRSDVTPAVAKRVRMLEIPDSLNAIADYPIALRAAAGPDARDFIALVLSTEGQAVLARHGLMPAGP